MEVILLQKVENLGDLGDRVKVKPGFGRNYLLPQGKATMATEDNIKMFEERRAELERAAQEALDQATARRDALQALGALTISAKAGEGGKLFGSVGPAEIAEALERAGTPVEKKELRMPSGPIRVTGEYDIQVHLYSDVDADVKVVVQPEQ